MTEVINAIPARLKNIAVDGHVCGTNDIIDDDLGLEQHIINKEVVGSVPYNSSNPNGMGRIVLKKNDNFKQVVEAQTNGNTIFIIKYDFTLSGDVTIPANCVLKFDGGSISASNNNDTIQSDNLVVVNDSRAKIFAGIKFDGRCKYYNNIKLEWFVSEYPVSVFDTSVDNTAEVRDCFSCGALNIEFPTDRYIHLTDTIHLDKAINIRTIDITKDWQTSCSGVAAINENPTQPCIFSTNIVTMFDYQLGTVDGNIGKPFSIGKISLFVNKSYNNLDDKEIPVINIETNGTDIWGINLDCDIKGRKYGYTANYTGIRIKSKNGYISMVRINGNIVGFFYAVLCDKADGDKNWFTDITISGFTWCAYGGLFRNNVGKPITIFNNHQCDDTDSPTPNGYFTGRSIKLYGHVWDCNSIRSATGNRNAVNPIQSITDSYPVFFNEQSTITSNYYKRYANVQRHNLDEMVPQIHQDNLLNMMFVNDGNSPIKHATYKINSIDILTSPSDVYNIDRLFNENFMQTFIARSLSKQDGAYVLLNAETNVEIKFKLDRSEYATGSSADEGIVFIFRNYNIIKCTFNVLIKDDNDNVIFNKDFEPEYYNGNTNFINLMTYKDNLNFIITASVPSGWLVLPTMIIPSRFSCANYQPKVRPKLTSKRKGYCYFDNSLSPKRPIWWDGSNWVDATGTQV